MEAMPIHPGRIAEEALRSPDDGGPAAAGRRTFPFPDTS
jgi:hypothetical protein